MRWTFAIARFGSRDSRSLQCLEMESERERTSRLTARLWSRFESRKSLRLDKEYSAPSRVIRNRRSRAKKATYRLWQTWVNIRILQGERHSSSKAPSSV